MSFPERLVPLDEIDLDLLDGDDDVAPFGPPPWAPPLAPVAHVFTSHVIFDEAIPDPCEAADWCRVLRTTGEGTHAAFLLDVYRNVAAAWFTDDPRVETVLTFALSTDIRDLAGRELVVVSAVDELGPTSTVDRQRFRRMVKKARRRNATLLDWVVGDAARARSTRLALDPGNDWPAAVVPDPEAW